MNDESFEEDHICHEYVSQCVADILTIENKNKLRIKFESGSLSLDDFCRLISQSYEPLMNQGELSYLQQLLRVLLKGKRFRFSKVDAHIEELPKEPIEQEAEPMDPSSVYWWRRLGQPSHKIPTWARRADIELKPNYTVSDKFLC